MALGIIGIVAGSALRRYCSSNKRIERKRCIHISVCWCR